MDDFKIEDTSFQVISVHVVDGVQQADTLMMEIFHQQHNLITFSDVGEVN